MNPAIATAVVGLGAISFEHLRKLQADPRLRIAGVCDLSGTLAEAMAERFGAEAAFTDFDELLERAEPMAVHVLTPPQSHEPLVTAALRAGAHVLVEKPAAPTWDAYAAMRDAARARGLLLCESYNYRFMPAVLEASAAVAAGAIGEVVNVDAAFVGVMGPGGPYGDAELVHFAHALPGGALQNFATHPVSLALPFMDRAEVVAADRRRIAPGFASDDELRALLSDGRVSAALTVSSHAFPPHLSLAVAGTRGTVEVDVFGGRAQVRSGDSMLAGSIQTGLSHLSAAGSWVGRTLAGRRDLMAGLGTLIERFYDAVERGGPPPVTVAEMDAVNAVMHQLFAPEAAT